DTPNYLCQGPNWPTGAQVREYRKTDELMLTASNFVPHGTEFIVEWSCGHAYPTTTPAPPWMPPGQGGQLIWHGLDRFDDTSFDGQWQSGEPLDGAPAPTRGAVNY